MTELRIVTLPLMVTYLCFSYSQIILKNHVLNFDLKNYLKKLITFRLNSTFLVSFL